MNTCHSLSNQGAFLVDFGGFWGIGKKQSFGLMGICDNNPKIFANTRFIKLFARLQEMRAYMTKKKAPLKVF